MSHMFRSGKFGLKADYFRRRPAQTSQSIADALTTDLSKHHPFSGRATRARVARSATTILALKSKCCFTDTPNARRSSLLQGNRRAPRVASEPNAAFRQHYR